MLWINIITILKKIVFDKLNTENSTQPVTEATGSHNHFCFVDKFDTKIHLGRQSQIEYKNYFEQKK